MLKKFYFLLVSSLLAVGSFAQSSGNNSLLWEISGNGLSKPSYIYGTIHLACKEDVYLGKVTQQLLKQSEKLVLEVNIKKVNPFSLMKKSMMKGDTSLDMLLSAEEYQLIDTYFSDSLKMPLSMLKKMKPLLLASMLLTQYIDCKQVTSIEDSLIRIATRDSVELGELETAEFQLSLFDSFSYREQAKALLLEIGNADSSKKAFSELLSLYKKQDVEGLYALTNKAMNTDYKDVDHFEEKLLFLRNESWIPKMNRMMHEGPMFFAVGAAHLGGPTGVIALLQKAGYQVKPLKN